MQADIINDNLMVRVAMRRLTSIKNLYPMFAAEGKKHEVHHTSMDSTNYLIDVDAGIIVDV